MKKYRDDHKEDTSEAEYCGLQWSDNATTAPADEWKNYIFQKDCAKVGNDTISTRTEDVSVPGLSTYWDEKDKYKAGTHDKYTSGIDCSGLVCMAANYTENTYKLPDVDEKTFVGKTVSASNLNTDSYSILMYGNIWNLSTTSETQYNNQINILQKMVPGDILVVSEDGKGYHTAIITTQINELSFRQIPVIHSIPYLREEKANRQNRVRLSSWYDIQNNVNVYKLRRLK